MDKFIFLDIDGVLNNQLYFMSDEYRRWSPTKQDFIEKQICPKNVKCLNTLTDATQAKIVLSSTWRKGRTLEELKDLFKKVDITGELIGMTPFLYYGNRNESVPRGAEIDAWIDDNFSSEQAMFVNYVILDDDSDMLYNQRDRFIWVDGYAGLTPNISYKAKNILLRG